MKKDFDYYMSLDYRIELMTGMEEDGYVLCCPEIMGCVASGDTIQAALLALEKVKKP